MTTPFRYLDTGLRFLRYYVDSVNLHGLQAPFAYGLYEAVLNRDRREGAFKPIEELRNQLLQDRRRISIQDFGAGFGGRTFHERSIRYITRNSSKPPRYARMLHRLVQHLHPDLMLELGTSVGISALYQSTGNRSGKLITVEGCPETTKLARHNFSQFPDLNIKLVEGTFDDVLPEILKANPGIDYLYIDGHHRLEPTLRYIELCKPSLSENAVVVVDDINWSEEMRSAWKRLKTDPFFTLSIDVFMMGFLFVSKDLSKENFICRY